MITKESSFLALNPAPLTNPLWENIWTQATVQKIKRKDAFIRIGKVARHSAFVLDGLFKQSYFDGHGNERNLDFYFPGEFICDCESYKNNRSSDYSFEALYPSRLLVISNEVLYTLKATDITFGLWGCSYPSS